MSKHYITLRAGIFTASLPPVDDPPYELSVVKPSPTVGVFSTPEATSFKELSSSKWTFRLLRIDPKIEGTTNAPIAEYVLVDEA